MSLIPDVYAAAKDIEGISSMNRMHPLTLRFHDPETERAFLRQLLPRLRLQGRAAIIVGVFVYFVYGALDHLFVPPEQLGLVWIIRMCALAVPMVVLYELGIIAAGFFLKHTQAPDAEAEADPKADTKA